MNGESSDLKGILEQFDPLTIGESPILTGTPKTTGVTTTPIATSNNGSNENNLITFDDDRSPGSTQSLNKETTPKPSSDTVLHANVESSSIGINENTNARKLSTHKSSQDEKESIREEFKKKNQKSADTPTPFDFQRFLDQIKHRSAEPIAQYLRSFLKEFSKRVWTTTEQVKIISDFQDFIASKMQNFPPFSSMDEHDFDNALEGMEKLIMNRLYNKTFSPEIPLKRRDDSHEEDVIRDSILEEKLKIWRWVEGRHLDLPASFLQNGDAFVRLASEELLKINNFRAPRDKVICMLNCCKVIFGLLRQSKTEENADAFLPILIYIVLKAQPKNLVSNINYIQRFRSQDRLSGEVGYYLSSIQGAVGFIENIDRSCLSITDEEFEKNLEESVRLLAKERQEDEAELERKKQQSKKVLSPKPIHKKDQSPGINESRTPSTLIPGSPHSRSASGSLTPSSVLANSAGLLAGPLKSITTLFQLDSDTEEGASSRSNMRSPKPAPSPLQDNKPNTLSIEEAAARQASAEEFQARKLQQQEHNTIVETLHQMFPALDKEVVGDVVRMKEGRVGACVDACLALVQ